MERGLRGCGKHGGDPDAIVWRHGAELRWRAFFDVMRRALLGAE